MRAKLFRALAAATAAFAAGLAFSALAQPPVDEGRQIFEQKCVGCHTIGQGDRVGPDLKGVSQRRDRDWLTQWIQAPDQMIARRDPTAMSLLDRYKTPMPNLGLTREQVLAVISYIDAVTAGTAAAPTASTIQLPAGDPVRGKNFFTGVERFQNGGPACLACHSVAGIGALGGGLLGPDLTGVLDRYGGPQGVAAFVGSPATPVMSSVWREKPLTPQELADVVAFLQQASVGERPFQLIWQLAAVALVGAVVLAGVATVYWRDRLAGGLRRRWLGYR